MKSLPLTASYHPPPVFSDHDSMHKDLAALIKKHSKGVQSADKKNRDVTKSDLEERAIKLGKKQRGEVCFN